jgi:ribosomal protein S18 acetylase RimI-like enzyme
MKIREYEDKDKEKVSQLWRTVFPDGPPHNEPSKVIEAKMKVQKELFLVAETDEQIIGTVMAGYDGHRGWLYSVAVAPEKRRDGIGAHLVKHAVNALKEMGCVKVNLQVRATNTQVVAFYESLGFSTEERVSMGKLLV